MVEETSPIIIWNKKASIYFKKECGRIQEESSGNSEKVKNGIIKVIDSLLDHPEKYSPDKFKKNNPGNYRAFEKYSYRVAYKYTEKEIRI